MRKGETSRCFRGGIVGTLITRRRAALVFVLLMSCVAGNRSAHAQTTLSLAATGEADVVADQVSATLTAQATSRNAATAQNGVNAAMENALALAKATNGVTATTANYSVSQTQAHDDSGPVSFTASEDLTLVTPAANGVPGPAFSAMLGKLQGQGLLLDNFDGGLSQAASRRAMQAAISDAMAQIDAQAKVVAGALHETIARTVTVNLNYSPPSPIPLAAPAMAMARMDAPVAAPANISITASVTATVELTAASGK